MTGCTHKRDNARGMHAQQTKQKKASALAWWHQRRAQRNFANQNEVSVTNICNSKHTPIETSPVAISHASTGACSEPPRQHVTHSLLRMRPQALLPPNCHTVFHCTVVLLLCFTSTHQCTCLTFIFQKRPLMTSRPKRKGLTFRHC